MFQEWFDRPAGAGVAFSKVSTNALIEEEDVPFISRDKRLFLRAGETVYHMHHRAWGMGRVVELMTSTLPGGCAFVRIDWPDGKRRVFNNDLDHYQCCYFFGLRVADAPVKKIPIPCPTNPQAPRRTPLALRASELHRDRQSR